MVDPTNEDWSSQQSKVLDQSELTQQGQNKPHHLVTHCLVRRVDMNEVQEFGGLEYQPGALDLKSQHLIAWSAALLTGCHP